MKTILEAGRLLHSRLHLSRRAASSLAVLVTAIISPFARADIPADYGTITSGLGSASLNTIGSPGSVAMHGTTAFPVVLGTGAYQYAVGSAGHYGDSYASSAACGVAFAHTGWSSTTGDYGTLLENAVKWAAKKTTPSTITIAIGPSTATASFFTGKGYTVKTVTASLTSANLSGVDVLLINMHSGYSATAVSAIQSYTASGKGVIMFATPWALSTQARLDANAILLPFGMTYSGSGPGDASFTISSTSYSPYYSALNGTHDMISDKEGTLTMALADKQTAANAVDQVIAVNSSLPALVTDLETLGNTSHYGWINVTPSSTLTRTSKPVEAMLARYQSAKFDSMAPGDLFTHPSASGFPGLPAAGSPVTKTVSVNGTTPADFYMNQGGKPTRIETGLYAAPGAVVTISIPSDKTSAGLKVHIGGSEDTCFNLGTWVNFPKIWRRVDLTATSTQTGNVFGGLVTLLVPAGSSLGTFNVTISGALEAPAFVLGQTTDAQWNSTVKNNPGAYGYIKTDKLTIYVPRDQLVALSNPTAVATYWKSVMDTSDDIYGYTAWRKRGEVLSANRQVSAGAAYAGYPIELGWGASSETELNNARINGSWGDYHELGHSYQDDFDGAFVIPTHAEVDVNINPGLLYTIVHDRTAWDGPTHSTYDGAGRLSDRTAFLALPADQQTWANACGRATGYDFYFNLAEAFGWQAYKTFFTRLMNYLQNPTGSTDTELKNLSSSDPNFKRNRFYLLMCDATGRNLDTYFQRYGLGVTGLGYEITQSVKDLVAAKSYPVWTDNSPIDSISNPGTLSVSETATPGSSLYQFTAVDADEPGTIWDYSITAGNDSGAFFIDKRTGILRVQNLDYEAASSYSLTVTVQDNGVPRQSLSRTFTVNVTNTAEAPRLQSGSFSATSNQTSGTVLGTIPMTLEPGRTLGNYSIIGGNSGGLFSINASTGELSLVRPEKLPTNAIIGLTIRATDNTGATGDTQIFIVANATTGVLEERWTGSAISGTPYLTGLLPSFATPVNVADNYYRRVSGYLIPPQTGYYTFWIASDDNSTLYLSTGSDPSGKNAIASVSSYTANQNFDQYASQKSVSILLQGGQPCYIEAQQREGSGGDHLSAAWAGPGFSRQIIQGSALVPNLSGLTFYSASPSAPVVTITRPASGTFGSASGQFWCQATLSDDTQPAPATIQWSMVSGPGTVTFGTPTALTTSAAFSAPGTYVLRCTGNDTAQSGQDQVTVHIGSPSPVFMGIDVGTVSSSGGSTLSSGTYTLQGGGADIWGTADAMHFEYQTLKGNGTITARVVSLQNTNTYAKAGVMIRNTQDPSSVNVATIFQAGGGFQMQYRNTAAGTTVNTGTATLATPLWVRLVRNGNTFTSFRSSDGANWTQAGTQTITMPTTVLVGLAVTSHNTSALTTAVFDNVSLSFTDNNAPVVSAGTNQNVNGASATLTGSASDDSLPNPPASLTYTWTQVSGPATATITSPSSVSTSVTFTQSGTYVFRLVADDGSAAGTNTVSCVVSGISSLLDVTQSDGIAADGSVSASSSADTLSLVQRSSTTSPAKGKKQGSDSSLGFSAEETSIDSASGTLPVPWLTADIGITGIATQAEENNGAYTITGAGTDLEGVSDSAGYIYQPITGNGEIRARLSALPSDGNGQTGVMMRESLQANAATVSLSVAGDNLVLSSRNASGEIANIQVVGTVDASAGTWLRLVRTKDAFTAYTSANGTHWTKVGGTAVPMTSGAYAGLTICSHALDKSTSVTFTQVTVVP